MKAKTSSKDALKEGKKEKLSVLAMLASMDQKSDKTKKGSSSKMKAKTSPKQLSYTNDIDLPPSDDEDEEYDSEEEHQHNKISKQASRLNRNDRRLLDVSIRKEKRRTWAAELAKQEALKDDCDAFTVVIGSRTSVFDGQDDADLNVKDITIDNFSVSALGEGTLKKCIRQDISWKEIWTGWTQWKGEIHAIETPCLEEDSCT